MPPKAKYSKESVIETALKITRESGIEALSARSLASALSSSTAPLFTLFESIEEIKTLVKERAYALYTEYIENALKKDPPFKYSGLAYIEFAKNEPMLFRLLFMQKDDRSPSHFFPAGDANAPKVQVALERSHMLEPERAKSIYNHLSVYVHGLAVIFQSGNNTYTLEDADKMISDVFYALIKNERN